MKESSCRIWKCPSTKVVGFMMIALALVSISPAGAQSLPSDAKETCTVPAGLFATWFETGSVSLNGVVSPADSVTFDDVPNCSFYQWAWQMFLWLTSEVQVPSRFGLAGNARVLDSPTFYDVSPPAASPSPTACPERTLIPHTPGKPPFFNLRQAQVGPHGLPVLIDKRGRMFEIEPARIGPGGREFILNKLGRSIEIERVKLGPDKKPIFLDKAGKAIPGPKLKIRPEFRNARMVQKFMIGKMPLFVDFAGNVVEVEQGQAGGSQVLEAQNGSLVYYETMVNDVYAYFLTGTKTGGITPTPTRFPTTPGDLNQIRAFATAHDGKVFHDADALAVEVKSSWVEAAGLPNPSSYITMRATIPTYDRSDPNKWTPNGQKTVLMALVGMHVVGSTGGHHHMDTGITGHPEMIWATFEHIGNTPNDDYRYINTNNQAITVNQNTAGNWLFCASNSSGPFNEPHMFFNPDNRNIESAPGFTISPSDTIRRKAWGGAFDVSPNPILPTPAPRPPHPPSADSNTEIISINNSVLGQLKFGDVRDVRANYFMTGATWTINGAPPDTPFNSGFGNEVGTSQMANTTMETYQQGPSRSWNSGTSCFVCHRDNRPGVSHMFCPLRPLSP